MPNQEFMEIIEQTESIAEEIIYNAKIDKKDKISQAKEQTKDVLIKARSDANAKYKETVNQQKVQGDEFLLQSINTAKQQADEIYHGAENKIDKAVKVVVEGIVGYCANH